MITVLYRLFISGKNSFWWPFFAVSGVALACNPSSPASTTEKKTIQEDTTKSTINTNAVVTSIPLEKIWAKQALPKDFIAFYSRFLKDKEFQLSNIKFPLEGFNTDAEAENDQPNAAYYWQKDTWDYMVYNNIDTTEYVVEYEVLDTLISETISLKNSGFYTTCNFKKTSGDWMLVYYGLHNL